MGESAVIATHIDSGWGYAEALYDNLDRYLEEEDPDSFIYVSSPDKNEDRWEEKADYTIESMNGCLDDEVEDILTEYRDITVVGGYWDLCHRDTWKDLMREINSRGDELPFDSYTLRIPLDCVSERPGNGNGDETIIANQFEELYIDDFLSFRMAAYTPNVWITDDGIAVEQEIDLDAGPDVSWTLDTSPVSDMVEPYAA